MIEEVRVPFRGEGDSIAEVVDAARECLEGDEQRIAVQLAYDALERGTTRAGELFEELQGPRRRQLVDQARQAIGLRGIEAERVHRTHKMLNAALPQGRDAQGRAIQQCPYCEAVSSTPEGALRPVPEARWHCASHKHLARPGDLDPPEDLAPRVDPATMGLRPRRDVEEAMRREQEKSRERERQRIEAKRREGAAIEQVHERYLDNAKPKAVGGFLVDARGRIVER